MVSASFPGGMWDGQAPEGTAPPYITYFVMPAPRTASYGSARYEPLVQFSAFGPNKDEVGTAFESFVAALDDQILSMTSGKMFDNRRTTEPTNCLMPTDGTGQPVWRWTADYQFTIRS